LISIVIETSDDMVGGESYDSLFRPKDRGSIGGSGNSGELGGLGGGKVEITVGSLFLIDGKIKADGANGRSRSGGGSGGTIWIKTGNNNLHMFIALYNAKFF